MKRFQIIGSALLLASLPCCKKQGSVGKMLDQYDSGWSVSPTYKCDPLTTHDFKPVKIADNARLDLDGFQVWFNKFIPDSRSTVMNYADWNRLLTSNSLSQEDRLKRMAMLGGSGAVYPFASERGNRGFLVIPKNSDSWAEVWDDQAVRRVRVDFEGRPTTNDVTLLLRCLSVLEWPDRQAEQAGPGQPATQSRQAKD